MHNIIICGTPGTGKSRLVDCLKSELREFNIIDLSKFAIENGCASDYDDTLESHIIDEDKLEDVLKKALEKTELNVIESIHADMLPPELIDWVFVCRTDNTILFDRLKARNYNQQKISNNLESEIFQLIADEARESFGDEKVTELANNVEWDLGENTKIVLAKIKSLLRDKENRATNT